MLYAILCYHSEEVVTGWTQEEDDAVMARLHGVHEKLARNGQLGPTARLHPTRSATTLLKNQDRVIDGPYAETKEQLLGFYVVDVADRDAALVVARDLTEANPGGAYELRPISLFMPGDGLAHTAETAGAG
jgi:hypothetical protein